MTALLSVRGLQAGYEDTVVLKDVAFEIAAGEVVCLLGSNGAGKTTLMGALTGLVACMAGEIVYDGGDLRAMAVHERVSAGVVLSPEGRKVFPNLTVEENLLLGSYNMNARAIRPGKLEEVYDLFPRLIERRRQKAGLMSGGEQQMLAIGRAVMANPRLLLLDEPSLGLAPKIILSVFEAIDRLARSSGLTILLVEQNMRAALSIATRGYVISNGRIVHAAGADRLAEAGAIFFGTPGSTSTTLTQETSSHA
jgi:branched-chain amino acid transport system ATP-binding protein